MVLTELVIGKGEIKIVFNFIFPFIYWKGIEFVLISCSQELAQYRNQIEINFEIIIFMLLPRIN